MKRTIYIVEDDPDICELLQFNLENEGYSTGTESHGDRAFDWILEQPPDLLILDLNLPGLTGIEICKYLRENARTKDLPILMLTARSQETDKLIGFETGADDYVTKPFSIREILARVQALLRRSKPADGALQYAELRIYPELHRVVCRENEVSLTKTEYKLLEALAGAHGRVLCREDLLDMVWGLDYDGDFRTVDVHVKRLRDKLGDCASLVVTVKGTGYRLKTE